MQFIEQKELREPDNFRELAGEALVVHRQSGRSNRALAIFVHGLGGKRYGRKPTWGRFPEFLFSDFPHVDVGLYSYRTLFRRLIFWKSISLETEAIILADILRDAKEYDTLIMLGHSMGGLLCQASIARLLSYGGLATLARIRGLCLLATPQAGSLLVSGKLGRFFNDAYALERHGSFVTSVQTIWQTRVNCDERVTAPNKIMLPTCAVLAASDQWVDVLSAGLNIPDDRKKIVHGSHTAIVKPQAKTDDVYQFIHTNIEHMLHLCSREPFEDQEAEIDMDIKDNTGGIVALEKRSRLHFLSDGISEYTEDMSCEPHGSIENCSVDPGIIRELRFNDGRFLIETTLDRIYNRGEVRNRVFRCDIHNSFTGAHEYWTQRQRYQTQHVKIRIKFPADRAPKHYEGTWQHGRESETPPEQPRLEVVSGRPTLCWDIPEPKLDSTYRIDWDW